MTTISETDFSSNGILMPKLPYQFKTFFVAPVGATKQESVNKTLRALELQTVAVQIPNRVTSHWIRAKLQSPAGTGRKRNHFKGIHTDGSLVVTVEDDHKNRVSAAIELAMKLPELNIVVANFYGDSGLLDAYLFTGVKLMTIEHSGFDYQPSAGGGSDTRPLQERGPIQLKKISFMPTHAQYYYQSENKVIPFDFLLGDI